MKYSTIGEAWKDGIKWPNQRNLRTSTKSGKQEISLQKWGLKPKTKVWRTCDIREPCSARWGCKTGKCHVKLSCISLSLSVRHPDQDGAEPSANSVSASNLLRLSHYTGKQEWLQKSRRLLAAFAERLTKVPIALPEMVRALMAQHYTLKQVIHLPPYFIVSVVSHTSFYLTFQVFLSRSKWYRRAPECLRRGSLSSES